MAIKKKNRKPVSLPADTTDSGSAAGPCRNSYGKKEIMVDGETEQAALSSLVSLLNLLRGSLQSHITCFFR